MKQFFLFLSLASHLLVFSQYGTIMHNEHTFGPCNNHLNTLGYKYNFTDLRKDTLIYKASKFKHAAKFVQKNTLLLSAEIFDEKGLVISSGNFANGSGVLKFKEKQLYFCTYKFSGGMLNDTTFFIDLNSDTVRTFMFKDNILIKEIWKNGTTRTVVKYDENGIVNDTTYYYGNYKPVLTSSLPYRYDSYNGKLSGIRVYDHGNLKEETSYKKDGSVLKQEKYKFIKKNYLKKYNKNCFPQ